MFPVTAQQNNAHFLCSSIRFDVYLHKTCSVETVEYSSKRFHENKQAGNFILNGTYEAEEKLTNQQ